MTHWFVIRTKPRKEKFASSNLERKGLETFLPRISNPFTSAISPLFPGYLFVRLSLEDHYYTVIWTPGVTKFVAFGETPCPVESSVVAFLHDKADRNDVIHPPLALKPGDKVRIRKGSLAGLYGIIENPGSGRGRVKVLMELLRRRTRVEVPLELLDQVDT